MIIYRLTWPVGFCEGAIIGPWNMTFYSTLKKTSDDPVYRLIKTNFKKEKQTFDINFNFPKSIKIILDLSSETRLKFKSWWQVIWMNKIWRTPKILRHFLLKQVLVFACPWINKNVPLVRSNSLALNSFCILVSQGKLRSEKMMKFVFMLSLICACLYSSRAGSTTQKQVRQSSGLFISEKLPFTAHFANLFNSGLKASAFS